jgi:hypothetical protein
VRGLITATHTTFTSALDGGNDQLHSPSASPLQRARDTPWIGECLLSGALLRVLVHGSSIAPARNQKTNPRTPSGLITTQIQPFVILTGSRKMKTWESNCYWKYKEQASVKVTGGRLAASSLNASRHRKSRMGPAEVIEAFNHWIP